jgi:hypothetical protein
MEELYYDEYNDFSNWDEFFEGGLTSTEILSDNLTLVQQIKKYKKKVAILILVCGLLIGICLYGYKKMRDVGEKKYNEGRSKGANEVMGFATDMVSRGLSDEAALKVNKMEKEKLQKTVRKQMETNKKITEELNAYRNAEKKKPAKNQGIVDTVTSTVSDIAHDTADGAKLIAQDAVDAGKNLAKKGANAVVNKAADKAVEQAKQTGKNIVKGVKNLVGSGQEKKTGSGKTPGSRQPRGTSSGSSRQSQKNKQHEKNDKNSSLLNKFGNGVVRFGNSVLDTGSKIGKIFSSADDIIDISPAANDLLYMIEAGSDKAATLQILKKIKKTLIDKKRELNNINKKAKSSNKEAQQQAALAFKKFKNDFTKNKSDLTKITAKIASNDTKIKNLLAQC